MAPNLTGIAALKASAPHLLADLSLSGMSALGNAIGLDPRISSLISVPVRAGVSGLSAGLLKSTSGGFKISSLFKAVKQSLLSSQSAGGLISVGVGW